MNELATLDSSWFVDEKCRTITNHYYDQLSPAIQASLKDKLKSLKRKDDYVEFLNGDGAVIWDEFIKDVAKSKKERDFSPLSDAEAEKLFSKINDSYELFSNNKSNDDDKSKKGFFGFLKNPLFIRLFVAILLLSGGFSVIFFTFFELPKITQKFQEETKRQVREDGIQDALEQVTKLIKSDDFEKMSDQVSALGSEFKKTQDSISKLSNLTSELALVRDQGKPAIDAIENQERAINSASKIFTEKVNKFNASINPLNQTLSKLSQSIDGWTDPVELRTAFESANKELGEYESKAASLLFDFRAPCKIACLAG